MIHELTHIWQNHTGISVFWRGIFEWTYSYGVLDGTRSLSSFLIEQQAGIVEDYYRLIQVFRADTAAADLTIIVASFPFCQIRQVVSRASRCGRVWLFERAVSAAPQLPVAADH